MKTSNKVNGAFIGVTGLKIKIWMEAVMAAAQQSEITGLIRFFDLKNLPTNASRWSRHENRKTEPEPDFIAQIENILPGTADVFYAGPDGFPLWEILEGNMEVCQQVIDSEIQQITSVLPDESWSFHERVMVIFSHRFPRDIDLQKLWDLISKDRSRELHEDFNVLTLTAKEVQSVDNIPKWLIGSEQNWERILGRNWENKFSDEWVASNSHSIMKDSSVITLSAGQIVTTIALYVLSRKKNELLPHCHYLVRGVLAKAVKEQVSFGATLAQFMNTEEWSYKNLVATD